MAKKLGFIGLGLMGSRMAANLLKAGKVLSVYNRSKEKADKLIEGGALWCDTPAQLAQQVEVLFTMLSTPDAVSATALGQDGHLNALKPGALWVDCSTVNPSFSKEMAARAHAQQIGFVDAPVFGSIKPAEEGTLPFFAGGKNENIEIVRPYLEIMGSSVKHVGDVGMGASMKMVLNVMLGQNMVMFSEAVNFGKSLGFSQEMLIETILAGPMAAPYLAIKSKKIEEGTYEAEFPLKWMHKDLHLVAQTAFENEIPLPSSMAVKEVFAGAKRAGLGEKDFAAIFEFINSKK